MKLFDKSKHETKEVVEIKESTNAETAPNVGALDEMNKVAHTINEIKEQNVFQAAFSGSKNERALAENDAIISNVIKNILNWLAVITSAETVRKEEYEDLTKQMLQFDQDINDQLEMQVKFKKAYETLIKRQNEQNALIEEISRIKRENSIIKIMSVIAIIFSCIGILASIFIK